MRYLPRIVVVVSFSLTIKGNFSMVPTRKSKFLSIINDINQSERLIRLPLWIGSPEEQQAIVVKMLSSILGRSG
jgi:hypothetical protein